MFLLSFHYRMYLTVIANRKNIEDREAFARELLQMYKDDSFHSTKFSTDRGYATRLDMNIYLWKEDIENEMFYNADWSGVNISEFIGILNDYLYWYNEKE